MTDATVRVVIRVEDVPGHPAFRPLAGLHGVLHDLRYASVNNFAGRVLYRDPDRDPDREHDRDLDCAWLRVEAAAGLEAAARWLLAHQPGWRLCVLDALRPQRVQEAIWAEVAGTPMAPYFADPAQGSIHSFGMAVDVTLVDAHGVEADMGSGFDEMTSLSHPALHAEHLACGLLQPAHVASRQCLHDAMAAGGFAGIATEWWHFDHRGHGDGDAVRRHLPRVD